MPGPGPGPRHAEDGDGSAHRPYGHVWSALRGAPALGPDPSGNAFRDHSAARAPNAACSGPGRPYGGTAPGTMPRPGVSGHRYPCRLGHRTPRAHARPEQTGEIRRVSRPNPASARTAGSCEPRRSRPVESRWTCVHGRSPDRTLPSASRRMARRPAPSSATAIPAARTPRGPQGRFIPQPGRVRMRPGNDAGRTRAESAGSAIPARPENVR